MLFALTYVLSFRCHHRSNYDACFTLNKRIVATRCAVFAVMLTAMLSTTGQNPMIPSCQTKTTNWERAGGFSGTMDGRFDTGKLLSIINQFSDDA